MQIVPLEKQGVFKKYPKHASVHLFSLELQYILNSVWGYQEKKMLPHFRNPKCNLCNLVARVHPCNYHNLIAHDVYRRKLVMVLSCRRGVFRRCNIVARPSEMRFCPVCVVTACLVHEQFVHFVRGNFNANVGQHLHHRSRSKKLKLMVSSLNCCFTCVMCGTILVCLCEEGFQLKKKKINSRGEKGCQQN